MSQADNRMLKLFDTGYTWKGNETEILREQSEPSGNSERKEDQPKKKGNTSLRWKPGWKEKPDSGQKMLAKKGEIKGLPG